MSRLYGSVIMSINLYKYFYKHTKINHIIKYGYRPTTYFSRMHLLLII